ncbi:MAG: helix-turn-helix domain-containing protein [Methylococcaceae bacterium]
MSNEKTNHDPLLSRPEAAIYLGLSVKTLAAWASNGRHELKMHKMGSRVKYRRSVLDQFIAEREV